MINLVYAAYYFIIDILLLNTNRIGDVLLISTNDQCGLRVVTRSTLNPRVSARLSKQFRLNARYHEIKFCYSLL